MELTIFVASTSDNKNYADKLCDELSGFDNASQITFKVQRWWKVFSNGDITLHRLLEVSDCVDCALFILDKSDIRQSRTVESSVPRDNLIFESGIFVKALGRKKCYLLVEPGVTLPTDLNGDTYGHITKDVVTVANQIKDYFQSLWDKGIFKSSDLSSEIMIISDPDIIEVSSGHSRSDYFARMLFIGSESAKNWIKLSKSGAYLSVKNKREAQKYVNSIVQDIRGVQNLISFGPADGEMEKKLLRKIKEHNFINAFVPIDINSLLLQLCISKNQNLVNIPFGINADFEGDFEIIKRCIQKYRRQRNLFCMFGITFGNFDQLESVFLSNLNSILDGGDYFLFDYAHEKNQPADESDNSQYQPIDEMPEVSKKFFIYGWSRRLKANYEQVFQDPGKFIQKKRENASSDIDGTSTIMYIDKVSHNTLSLFRRYKRDKLQDYLRQEHGFELIKCHSVELNEYLDQDICLLVKK